MISDKEILDQGLKRLSEHNVYRYRSFERGLDIIENQELFLAKPSSLNDPFDCFEGLIDFKITKEFIQREISPFLKFKGVTRPIRKEIELKLLRNKSQYKTIEFFEKYKQRFGICCFSWSYNNIVLWANYSGNHTGICLGFKGLEPVNSKWGIYPVYYTSEIKKYTFTDFEDRQYWKHWLTTKAKDWEYEDEVRLISKSHNGLLPFPKNCISEIFLGMSITDEKTNLVIDSLKQNHYSAETKVYKMIIDKYNFKLVPKEITWNK